MTRTMTRAATWIFLAAGSGAGACAQVKSDPSAEPPDGLTLTMGMATLSTSSPSAHKLVRFEGLLARSDEQTLSIELPDERVMVGSQRPDELARAIAERTGLKVTTS